ncbi:MAG: type II secretion system F family protein [Planctomycetaceae bacterium]|nr:type II secretion system F family protein [Planctomycetaceae bacterium]MCA9020788.1 type II secretion system F family protein [Planctomycetaceae bacterium]
MDKKSHFENLNRLFGNVRSSSPFETFLSFGRVSYSQQVALLRILAIAADKQLPLIDVLETFGKDIRGHWRYQIMRLVDLLRSGVPLAEALEKIPYVIPANAFFLVKAGAESGTLPSALALAAEVCAEQRNERDYLRPGIGLYLCTVFLIMLLVFMFICYWIIPKMKKIYYDFNMEMPDLTIAINDTSDLIVTYVPLLIPGILILFFLYLRLRRSGYLENGWRPRFVSGRYYPRLIAPDVLRFLHVTTESGRPLLGAFETLSNTTKNKYLSARFNAILEDVHKGNDCWTSLHDYSLLTPSEVRLLQSAQRAGNLSWALKAIAKGIERRINYRMALLREYLEPTFILGLGCVVGIFVIGLFLPLVTIMNALS